MKVSIGNDHGGLKAKLEVVNYLKEKGIEILDRGTHTSDSCDYPLFAKEVAKDVQEKNADFGILICNSGEGMAIAANKFKGIRAAVVYNKEVAHLVKEHNHANVITFGANFFTSKEICEFIDIYLKASELGDRHQRRVDEMMSFES